MGRKSLISYEKKVEAVERYLRGEGSHESIVLKCEMYYFSSFKYYDSLVAAIEENIHFYNHERRQAKLKQTCPMTYRRLIEEEA